MQKLVSTAIRGAFVTAVIATLVAASPAHATGDWWSWWNDLPSWWPFRPQPVSTPEIDAGLVRGAAAIIAGSLVMMRSRKKRSD
jgi:hypothetical protein